MGRRKVKQYPLKNRTIGYILEDKVKEKAEEPFLYFKDDIYSYKSVNTKSNRIANGYQKMGVKKGDRIVSMMPNCPEFIFHWFGLSKLGAVDTPINVSYKGEFLRHAIENVGAKVMLVHQEYLERLIDIQSEIPELEKVFVYPSIGKTRVSPRFKLLNFEELVANKSTLTVQESIHPFDPLMIIYTSGTTGPSKGVVLSHHALYCYSSDAIRMRGFRPSDIMYTSLPLFHGNARLFAVMGSLLNGASFAMAERFSASRFWSDIKKYRATIFTFLGGIPTFLLNQPAKPEDAENTVRAAFGGPVAVDVAKEMEKRFNLKVYTGFYGMTEASGVTYLNVQEMDKLKAEGNWQAALGMGKENKEIFEMKLMDENFEEVPVGEIGEIVCRPSRPYSMMTEYFNMPEKTLEVFRNLWFHTGDLAKKDENGFYHFMDRKKDYIRRRGENISSFEVEKCINRYPAVLESAAIGIKSEVGEDEVLIAIKPKAGQNLVNEDLMAWCESRMPYFMIPRYVRLITEDLPKTPTGKVQKHKLRQDGVTGDTWDREKAGYMVKR
jgi:crotonobetaine/carnitine-CoA ligase